MEIDFSPLQEPLNRIFFYLIEVLGIPFIIVMILGALLRFFKVPSKIVIFIATALYLFGVYQMFMILEF